MAALIEYVCRAQRDRRDEPSVTLEQGFWAYCSRGATAQHQWTRIDPTALEALRPEKLARVATSATKRV